MSISKVEFLNASSSLIIVKIKTEKLGWKIARRFKFSKSAKNYNLKSILVSDRLGRDPRTETERNQKNFKISNRTGPNLHQQKFENLGPIRIGQSPDLAVNGFLRLGVFAYKQQLSPISTANPCKRE